jgi:hypothetical protein
MKIKRSVLLALVGCALATNSAAAAPANSAHGSPSRPVSAEAAAPKVDSHDGYEIVGHKGAIYGVAPNARTRAIFNELGLPH